MQSVESKILFCNERKKSAQDVITEWNRYRQVRGCYSVDLLAVFGLYIAATTTSANNALHHKGFFTSLSHRRSASVVRFVANFLSSSALTIFITHHSGKESLIDE